MNSKPTPSTKRASKVRPAKGPAAVGKAPLAPGAGTAVKGVGLPLPHERDESTRSVAAKPDPVMVQAHRDIEAGLVDTDMRATPGLDAQRRAALVPGAGGKPPRKGR
jgi:hypothetical protein